MRSLLASLLLVVCLHASPDLARASAEGDVEGTVTDVTGGAIAGALVTALPPAPMTAVRADAAGRFAISTPDGVRVVVRVTAPGFAPAEIGIDPAAGSLRVVLLPASLDESVTVTASRGSDTATTAPTTTVVSGAALIASGAGALDDALRQTPGFSLFRRSTSRVANPTTQGVTLRGVSGSGASRSTVLADGVALNDPFGSWVYWNRIPLVEIERVEVMRGAGGDLYGAEALGGVIQILTRDTRAATGARILAEYGSHETGRVSGLAAARRGAWSAIGTGEWYDTSGAYVIAAADRGTVDTRAASEYVTTGARAAWQRDAWQASVRVRASDERRANGTRLQVNDTNWRQWSAAVDGTLAGGQWAARAVTGSQGYYQTFSAILPGRASERLTSEQRIPTTTTSGQAQWARTWTRAAVLIGGEGHRTESAQTERRYGTTGALIEQTLTGGTERAAGGFARVSLTPTSRLTIGAGTRIDRVETSPVVSSLPAQSSTNVNPRLSIAWTPVDAWSVHGAAYRSARTPTLNERYRAFRVGNVLTNANPLLDPERLSGMEAGIAWRRRTIGARAAGYWNRLEDAITNVTLSSTPTQVTRQRQNTDTLRARGIELETEWRPAAWMTVSGALSTGIARVRRAPAQPQLVGNDVPQAPSYQWSIGATIAPRRLGTLTLQARRVGRQFDDDLNTFVLQPFTVVDAAWSRAIARGVAATVAIENAFDAEYDVARTPTRSIGWPRAVRVGLRWFVR